METDFPLPSSQGDTDILNPEPVESTYFPVRYEELSSQTGTFNFTGIKRDPSVAVLPAVVSGNCVLLLIGGAHVAGQSRDR